MGAKMRERTPADSAPGDEEAWREEERGPSPRIYVASLADYNEGRLHGAWIDAAQSAGEIMVAVRKMLRASLCPNAEEWAIHDYEGFGALTIHESEDFETVARLAAGIAEHGEALAAYAEHVGSDSELLDAFEDAYLGEYQSGAQLAEELLEGSGIDDLIQQLPEPLRRYVKVDYEAYFDDLVAGGEVIAVASRGGGIHVFQIP